MARLPRVFQKLFGSGASTNQMASEFGSLANATPSRTDGAGVLATPSLIQSLTQWVDGWFAESLLDNALALEDLNSFSFLTFYQICYLMQAGIAEYDPDTTYYQGSLVQDGMGRIIVSNINDNTGNDPVTTSGNWLCIDASGGSIINTSINYSSIGTESLILANTTSGNITVTLPDLGTVVLGQVMTIKNNGATANNLTIAGFSGGQTIDGQTNYVLTSTSVYLPTLKVRKISSTQWAII